MQRTTPSRFTARRSTLVALLAAAVLASALTPIATASAEPLGKGTVGGVTTPPANPSGRTGRTEATALASCWDVKQVDPAAASGLYWLYTPALGAPQQFYCDMTTDGGGWVLIGRGREGWAFLEEGQGAASEVSATVTGTAAFAPKHLTGATVSALLNGTAVQSLTDGIRVRRATNAAGTTWQEVRMRPSRFVNWRWALNAFYPLTSTTFDGVGVSGGSTAGTGSTGLATLRLTKIASNTFLPGFGYSTGVAGTSAATSYLWSATGTTSAIPFAQLYLRPKTRWADLSFPSVAAGLPSSTVRSVASNLAAPQPAGVTGQANGFTTERDTEVRAFAQLGQTMFVGGNFSTVNNYAAGTTLAHPYLAAFDVTTGAHLPGFLPALNGKVNALAPLPGGLLAVGGEFTTVNGVNQAGLVVLDPATGQIAPGFTAAVEYRSGGLTSPGSVTALAVTGNTLYLGGSFTHASGGGAGFAYLKRGARLDATTGAPDTAWNPAFDGTPIFISLSASGDRAYYGGFMSTMNDDVTPALRFVAVTTTAPAQPVAGLAPWVMSSGGNNYQQTGVEVGDRFWLGGSEHSFFMYDRSSFSLLRGNITRSDSGSGGDFQSSAVDGGVVYGSCHCILSSNYGDGRRWPTPTTFDDVGAMRYIAAYDAVTGRQVDAFLPQMKTRAVRGPWAMTVDSQGCLWAGGDTTETKVGATTWQPSGGFSRFCRTDSVAPDAPTGVATLTNADGTVTVSWTGPETGLRFRLYRGDQVVWSGTNWKATLPAVPGAAYAVQAVDKAGNTGATTAQALMP